MLSKSIVTGSFDASQGSALFDAARDGDVEVLEACIFGGMEIDFRDGTPRCAVITRVPPLTDRQRVIDHHNLKSAYLTECHADHLIH